MKIITAFNIVQDLIIEINDEIISLLNKKNRNIVEAIYERKDIEIPLNKKQIEEYIASLGHFVKERRIGGQAAIAAEELSRNGIKTTLYSHYCNPHLIFAYHKPAIRNCIERLRTNLVLEYEYRINDSIVKNRLILADRSIITLPYSEIKISADLGFFGGFHHIENKNHLKLVHENLPNLEEIKNRHVELALNKNKNIAKDLSKHIFPFMHSIGMNKYEMLHYYSINNPYNFEEVIKKIMKDNIRRLHFHDSFAHYVIIKDPNYKKIKNEIYGMIKGNEASYAKAKHGFVKTLHLKKPKYIIKEIGDYSIIGMELIRSQEVKRTVGLGDVLSAFSFVHSALRTSKKIVLS